VKRVCVVTSSRADYGVLKPLLSRLNDDSDIELSIVVTGMHLCPEFGNTYQEIEADGFIISEKINIQEPGDTPAAMSKTMGNALSKFSDYFEKNTPDLLVVLGDRYEMMAVCCAAVNRRIPIAHIHGGETTEGAVDEFYRHSITKMSALHFTCCQTYRKRVIQMGEHPERVFNVGSLGVENILNAPLLLIEALENDLGFSLHTKPYGVVVFHPVTLEDETGAKQVKELLMALDSFPNMQFLMTKSNSDAGGMEINKILEKYCDTRDNCILVASLGMKRYLSVLKHAKVIIGNSSSGILEAPASKTPTVNIGDRQKGREMADTVINCKPEAKEIIAAINKAISPDFREVIENVKTPYGNGGTSREIISIIKSFLENGISIKKSFYDFS